MRRPQKGKGGPRVTLASFAQNRAPWSWEKQMTVRVKKQQAAYPQGGAHPVLSSRTKGSAIFPVSGHYPRGDALSGHSSAKPSNPGIYETCRHRPRQLTPPPGPLDRTDRLPLLRRERTGVSLLNQRSEATYSSGSPGSFSLTCIRQVARVRVGRADFRNDFRSWLDFHG